MTESMRPGVWVEYETYPLNQVKTGRTVGIAAAGTGQGIHRIKSAEEAEALFGPEAPLTLLVRAVMENAGCQVLAAPISKEEDYPEALAGLAALEEPYCLVCGTCSLQTLQAGKTLLEDPARCEGGKLLFAGIPAEEDGGALAAALNCQRIILTAPAVFAPAVSGSAAEGGNSAVDVSPAVTAALASRSVGSSLFGEEVLGDYVLSAPLSEAEINRLLAQGVTVLEEGAVSLEIVRCVTTRTRDDQGSPQGNWRNLAGITALDQVVSSLKALLKAEFAHSGGRLTAETVRSLIESELLELQEEGLISGYEPPVIEPDPEDPALCRVSLRLRAVQGICQVRLTALVGV